MTITAERIEVVDSLNIYYVWKAEVTIWLAETVYEGFSSKRLLTPLWSLSRKLMDLAEAIEAVSWELPITPFSWDGEQQWVELTARLIAQAKDSDEERHRVMATLGLDAGIIAAAFTKHVGQKDCYVYLPESNIV